MLTPIHEFTYRTGCSAPLEVGTGPQGQRHYYELTDGVIEGERLRGTLVGSAGDWMLTRTDGFMRMDVRLQIETDDGAIVLVHYFGLAEANTTMTNAVVACTPTDFADQSIRTHWLLESGDPRYSWINQAVFVGEGRLCPGGPGVLGFEHRIYRLG